MQFDKKIRKYNHFCICESSCKFNSCIQKVSYQHFLFGRNIVERVDYRIPTITIDFALHHIVNAYAENVAELNQIFDRKTGNSPFDLAEMLDGDIQLLGDFLLSELDRLALFFNSLTHSPLVIVHIITQPVMFILP